MTELLTWPRWTDYVRHADGWIYAAGEQTAPYDVTGGEDLAAHLARVAEPPGAPIEEAVQGLLAFYRTFGLLGRTLGAGGGLDGPRAARFDGRLEVRPGDPVAWALEHAGNVRLILMLRHARGDDLDTLLESMAKTQLGHAITIPTTAPPFSSNLAWNIGDDARLAHGPGRRQMARQMSSDLLNPNLATVSRMMVPETGELRFRFDALIEALYWQMADDMTRYQVRRCECGARFFARDERQIYCPPPPGIHESRCGKRFRMRKLRETAARPARKAR